MAKGTIKALACDAIWPKDRAISLGYQLNNALCELCLAVDDSLLHRLWYCTHSQEERDSIVSQRVWNLLAAADLCQGRRASWARAAPGKNEDPAQ